MMEVELGELAELEAAVNDAEEEELWCVITLVVLIF